MVIFSDNVVPTGRDPRIGARNLPNILLLIIISPKDVYPF